MSDSPKPMPEDDDPQKRPRYTGITSFMRAPIEPDLEKLDIAMLGVPYDGGVTNRPGARHGPRAIREASSLIRKNHAVSLLSPWDHCRIGDAGDAWVRRPFALEESHKEIAAFYAGVKASGALPLSAGGDHSVSLPILRGLVGDGPPVALIQIDAHADTGDDYLGSRFHHGAPFRRAAEEGLIDPGKTVQIGIRGSLFGPDMWQFSYDSGMTLIAMHEVEAMGLPAVIARARAVVGDTPCYLTFDIDALDPAFAPGTGTPEIGGFSTREALTLLRGLAGLDFIGADLVEVAPPFDAAGLTAMAGANLMFEELCLLTESWQRRLVK